MEKFLRMCREQLVKTYNEYYGRQEDITYEDTFIVWACKTLQNYKCLASTSVNGDGVYVEYTYNGDKKELYEDFYTKEFNTCIKDC